MMRLVACVLRLTFYVEERMSRRRGARPSNRQILAIVAIVLALLTLTNIGGVPWLTLAVIVLALAEFI